MKRKLEDFGELWPAEQTIVDELDSGEYTILYDNLPPEEPDMRYDVRAAFIRYLALGGCGACRLHEKGLRILGARVVGELDLEGGVLPRSLALIACRFVSSVNLSSAKGQNFHFNQSHFRQGIWANRLEAEGDVFLREVIVSGTVYLIGAKMGGNLSCDGASFSARPYVDRKQQGHAFVAEGLEAKGAFFFRDGARVRGRISLRGANVALLNDSPTSWPEGEGQILLERFRYGAILGREAPVDANTRIAWLAKTPQGEAFSPQPYEQLAKVLREMGHREDARVVLIEKERVQRVARRARVKKDMLFEDFYWLSFWDRMLDQTVRFGYRPFQAFGWLLAIFLVGTVVFGMAAGEGAMKPNDSRVWLSEAWGDCGGDVACFMSKAESYPAFNPYIYSADVLLPIVDFDMQDTWIPDEDKAPMVRGYMWLHIALGWFFSLLAVAGFSGLIKPE